MTNDYRVTLIPWRSFDWLQDDLTDLKVITDEQKAYSNCT